MAKIIFAKTSSGDPGTGLSSGDYREHKAELVEYQDIIKEISVTARLNCKAWGSRWNLVCFFEGIVTGNLFKVSAFRSKNESMYSSRDAEYDFSTPGIEGEIFELKISINSKGKPRWDNAIRVK